MAGEQWAEAAAAEPAAGVTAAAAQPASQQPAAAQPAAAAAQPPQPPAAADSDQLSEQLESAYVHQVYDAIAPHFSATRFAIWPKVRV